jgi:hypothetical protein
VQDLARDLRRQAADIRQLGREAEFAAVVALTRTAQDVRAAEQREIDDSFDRPNPYTRNAIFVRPATRQTMEAQVGIKDDLSGGRGARAQSTYLEPQIEGGGRRLKAFERALRSLGVMDGTQYVVPGQAARIDAYGNIERGQILQVLSQLRAFTGAETVSRNLVARKRAAAFRRAGGQYFAVGPYKRGGLAPGIYQRQVASRRLVGPASPRPRPVMIFVDRAQYEQRFDFWSAGRFAIERSFPRRLSEAVAGARGLALAAGGAA